MAKRSHSTVVNIEASQRKLIQSLMSPVRTYHDQVIIYNALEHSSFLKKFLYNDDVFYTFDEMKDFINSIECKVLQRQKIIFKQNDKSDNLVYVIVKGTAIVLIKEQQQQRCVI